jgi:NADH-quinone oxidoreductase subunit A
MPGTYIPTDYFPVAILVIVALMIGLGALVFGLLLRPRRHRFSIKFYIIAMLFVVFDVEAVFLYPWAVAYDKLGLFGLVEMMLFIFILLIGYVYVWKKGAFDWE